MISRLHVKYLLIGGGAASSGAAFSIRQHDSQGSLLVVGQEINRPYYRAALSGPYLRGQMSRDRLYAVDASWYGQNGVILRTGQRAVHLDTIRRLVILDSGEEISFDRLLIATGAVATHLTLAGADLPGVYYLRTLEDADRLHHAVGQARQVGRPHHVQPQSFRPPSPGAASPTVLPTATQIARGRTVVVGAERRGVEIAATLSQLGMEVELLAAASYPWAGFAGESIGRFVTTYLETCGIRVHNACAPIRFEGDGRVQRVVIPANGITNAAPIPAASNASVTASPDMARLDCDFVVVALAMQVQKDLLRGTSIAAEKAILIDEACRTSVTGIYAAGDCAAIFDPLFGKHSLCEHWDSAVLTGAIAGENMTASAIDTAEAPPAKFAGVGSFQSEIFGLSLHGWGEERFVSRRLLRGLGGLFSTANTGISSHASGSTAIAPSGRLIEFGIDAGGWVAQVLLLETILNDDTHSTGTPAAPSDIHAVLQRIVRRRLNVSGMEEQIKDPAMELTKLPGL